MGFNESVLSIVNVTDKSATTTIAQTGYPNAQYTHQGWFTTDFKYIVMNDELDESNSFFLGGPRTVIWDMEDLDDPVLRHEYHGTVESVDHNLYVHNGYAYLANYAAGLRILDLQNIDDPKEVAFFDTAPSEQGLSFWGAWSVYPFFESGTLLVSSQREGLFLLRATGLRDKTPPPVDVSVEQSEIPDTMQLLPAHPNPANPTAALTIQLPAYEYVRVVAYDMTGREVHVLHDGTLDAGNTTLRFDGSDLPAGRYAIRAMGESTSSTQLITLTQ